MTAAVAVSMLPIAGLRETDKHEANRLLVEWDHPLGPCNRPFASEYHTLDVDGHPVGVTVSASIVSTTVEEYVRGEVVELARIARHPAERWVMRPLLRLWREVLGPRWRGWPVAAAISYQLPGTEGDIYRFDGWERIGPRRKSSGGGSWTRTPAVSQIGDGVKTLWMWRYR